MQVTQALPFLRVHPLPSVVKKGVPRNPAANPNRPFVLINMGMTADGKIATPDRSVSTFGSAADHEHLLELRATVDAVMSGARTVDSHAVDLGPGGARFRRQRLRNGLSEYNLRVVVSGSASLDPGASIFDSSFSPIIALTSKNAPIRRLARLRKAGAEIAQFGEREVDLRQVLRWLRKDRDVERLLCEGGGELNDAMFRADLVDEVHLTVCPLILGGRNASTISDGVGFPRLPEARPFELRSRRQIGEELFCVYRRPS